MAKASITIVPGATITTFDDVVAQQTVVVEAAVYGGGDARLIRDKRELIDRRFLVMEWEVRSSETNTFVDADGVIRAREYVSVVALLETEGGVERVVFNDGGAGIRPVLERHETQTGRREGLLCKGLRVSEYEYTAPDGARSQARTFYLQ